MAIPDINTPSRLPDIKSIDLSNPYDIGGYVSLLCQAGGEAGMISSGFRPTRESNMIRQTARLATRLIEEHMTKMPPGDALLVVPAHDLAHRIAYGTPADTAISTRCLLKAFDAMIHGDRSVDEYVVYDAIDRSIAQPGCDAAILDRPFRWRSISLDRWYRQFKTGHTNDTPDTYDIIQRLSILLESDLWAYETVNETAYKQSLVDRHRHLLEQHPATDPRTRQAQNRLQHAASRYLPTA